MRSAPLARPLACLLALLALAGVRPAAAQSFEVWTDRQEYAYGEEIRYVVMLANDTERTLRFYLPIDGPAAFLDGTYTGNDFILPTETPHELAPGEALLWKRGTRPQVTGLPEEDGRHWLRVWLGSSGLDPEEDSFIRADSILFEAPRYLGGQVEVSFADADTAYARAVRDALGAEVVQAAAFGGNQYQTWRFEGISLAEAVARYGADTRLRHFSPSRGNEAEVTYSFARLPARRPLRVSVDTLRYPEQRDIVLTNVLQQPVTITGLSLSRSNARSWVFGLENGDPMRDWMLDPFYDPDASVGLPLDPGASLTLQVTAFDPCLVCKRGAMDFLMPDTLLIHTDASGIPDAVILDPSGYVSADPVQQPGALRADVYPNPARGAVTVEVEATAGGAVAVEVFDALGRRVARTGARAEAAGVLRVPLDAAHLPAGLYFCRVTAGGETITRALTLVR